MAGDLGINLVFYRRLNLRALALLIYRISVTSRERFELAQTALRPPLRSVLDGLHYLQSHSTLRTNSVILAIAALLSSGTLTLAYGYATEVTGKCGYSTIEAAMGLGTVAGGLTVGRRGDRFPKNP